MSHFGLQFRYWTSYWRLPSSSLEAVFLHPKTVNQFLGSGPNQHFLGAQCEPWEYGQPHTGSIPGVSPECPCVLGILVGKKNIFCARNHLLTNILSRSNLKKIRWKRIEVTHDDIYDWMGRSFTKSLNSFGSRSLFNTKILNISSVGQHVEHLSTLDLVWNDGRLEWFLKKYVIFSMNHP